MLDGTSDVCVLDGLGERLHPGAQVARYCAYMRDFVAALEQPGVELAGAAYLHNADDLGIAGLWSLPETEYSRLFTGQQRGAFLDFLRTRLSPEHGAGAADFLLNSAVRPSKQLMALAADEVQQREQFVRLDEQQTAFSLVIRAVEESYRANTKEVIVVSGGPGSGKSVIALSLMGELARRGRTVLHATGSRSFTKTLRKVAGRRAPAVQSMFKFFNQFVDAEKNGLDVLIADEAHRIRETSANRYTKAQFRTGRPQVQELIDAARVPVFLLDEHQVVRPGEIGTIDDIEAAAAMAGINTRIVSLDGQFRLGGSRKYEEWVLHLLGLAPSGPVAWDGDESFTHPRRRAGPGHRHRRLAASVEQQKGHRTRRGAGYAVLGDRSRRLRPGRLRLHRTGLRVRLLRRHHRAGSGLAHRPLGGAPRGEPRHADQAGDAGRVRPRGAQHVQGAADARAAGDDGDVD